MEKHEKRVKNQRCSGTGDNGRPCYRYISEEWACVRCGRRACKWHSQSITFNNHGNEGVACLCSACMCQMGHGPDEPSGSATDLEDIHRQAQQTYNEMFELATKRQIHHFRRMAEEALQSHI